MHKKILKKIIPHFILTLLFIFAIPSYANAAKIFIDLPETPLSVGNTSIIKVMLDTDQEINASEGVIKFSTPKDVVALNIGGSVFNLWPRKPSLDGDKISFVGGAVSGVYGKSLRLFTIAIKPASTESIKISLEDGVVFLNDGKGTKITASLDSIEIPVQTSDLVENELATLVREDNTPPNKFKIELGHDPSVYEGKYFISFFTTDDDSGIERYEIVEGGRASVRSGSTYVLLDQSLSSLITVRAIDNAGNERVETFNPQEKSPVLKIFTVILIILLILVLLFIIYFFVLRKRR